MASRGTRNTELEFGGFMVAISFKKCHHSRDLKTEVVNEQGAKIAGGGGGGNRKLRDGEARAVRVSEQHIVRLPQVELDKIVERSQTTYERMQVLETVDYRQVPTERIDESYWIQPAQGSASTLALLAEALRQTGKVAIVKWVASSREKLGVIRVRGREGERALLLSELAFANDFLAADGDALEINNVELDERAVPIAVNMIESFARPSGAAPQVDMATDTAVDARIALFKLLCDTQTEQQLEASVAAVEAAAEEASEGGTLLDLEAARSAA